MALPREGKAASRNRSGEEDGLQTYLRPLFWEALGLPGHDGIRAQGSQSLKAASKARLVVGLPRAGPTCVAIIVPVEQRALVG
jgi:hypothetical protein